MTRRRLDVELVRRGLAPSRQHAQRLIDSGAVLVRGAVADKAVRMVSEADPVLVASAASPFVSRGGEKLEAALARFDIDVAGRRALDAGASTGGFTDCLLQRGAGAVVAVDVGYGQLYPRLRADPRVTVHERTNIRTVDGPTLGAPFEVVVADLSFISLTAVLPRLAGDLAADGAAVVVLVKPQFEAGRQEVRRGKGVVRSPAVRRDALERVASATLEAGASIMGAMASPVLGPAGNAEYLLVALAHHPGAGLRGEALSAAVAEAVAASPDDKAP